MANQGHLATAAHPLTEARFPAGLLWAALLLALTIAGSVVWGVSHFEDDLRARSSSVLETAGLDLTVTFDGRDAVVEGRVGSAADAALAGELVAGVRGVRRVELGVVVGVPAADPGGGGDA